MFLREKGRNTKYCSQECRWNAKLRREETKPQRQQSLGVVLSDADALWLRGYAKTKHNGNISKAIRTLIRVGRQIV